MMEEIENMELCDRLLEKIDELKLQIKELQDQIKTEQQKGKEKAVEDYEKHFGWENKCQTFTDGKRNTTFENETE